MYMVAAPLVVGLLWHRGFSWPLYGLLMFLSMGISVIRHNHTHLPMWRTKKYNRLTDLWLSLLQGHPTCIFYPAHVANHHRHKHGEHDVARTYAFGGDTNNLWGYLSHPVFAVSAIYPLYLQWLYRQKQYRPKLFRFCCWQYLIVLSSWLTLAILDWQKWALFVLIPQLHGLHWLLATNYLQHAHADGRSTSLNYARNFEGLVNPLLFNIGLHTAHHEHPRVHWSELGALHKRCKPSVCPSLNEPGLIRYMFRVFIASIFLPKYKSRSLMQKEAL